MSGFPATYREVHVDSRPYAVARMSLSVSNPVHEGDPQRGKHRYWIIGVEEALEVGESISFGSTSGLDGFPWAAEDRNLVLEGNPAAGLPMLQFVIRQDDSFDVNPETLAAAIEESELVRYVVPVYFVEDPIDGDVNPYRGHPFAMVPDTVLVTIENPDEKTIEEINERANELGFQFVDTKSFSAGPRYRMVFSSRFEDDKYLLDDRYVGEPGRAMELVTRIRATYEHRATGFVRASHDWFTTNPNPPPPMSYAYLELTSSIDAGPLWSLDSGPLDACTKPGSSVKIAVLDGEFDLDHPLLCFSKGMSTYTVPEGKRPGEESKNHAHGTLCSGILGAKRSYGWKEGGVLPGVELVPVTIYRIDGLGTDESPFLVTADLSHLTEGIKTALNRGCDVLSISVAGYLPEGDLLEVIEAAEYNNVVIVSGTGNLTEGIEKEHGNDPSTVLLPAGLQTVLAVGAATTTNEGGQERLERIQYKHTKDEWDPPWQSHFGHFIDVVAPGLFEVSTDLSGRAGANVDSSPDGDLYAFSGTSCAVPFVAATAAMLIREGGLISALCIRNTIRNAAREIRGEEEGQSYDYGEEGRTGWSRKVGHGFLDRAAIRSLLASGPEIDCRAVPNTVATPTHPFHPDEESLEDDEPRSPDDKEDYPVSDAPTCGCRQKIPSRSDRKPWVGRFENCLKPLSDFLESLGSEDAFCCKMTAQFWRDPYRTAIEAGLPWHAAVMLGQGDWVEIYDAVNAEQHKSGPPTAGPIWVRAG